MATKKFITRMQLQKVLLGLSTRCRYM